MEDLVKVWSFSMKRKPGLKTQQWRGGGVTFFRSRDNFFCCRNMKLRNITFCNFCPLCEVSKRYDKKVLYCGTLKDRRVKKDPEWFNKANTLRQRQSDRHFADNAFIWIFLKFSIQISLNISYKAPINNHASIVSDKNLAPNRLQAIVCLLLKPYGFDLAVTLKCREAFICRINTAYVLFVNLATFVWYLRSL